MEEKKVETKTSAASTKRDGMFDALPPKFAFWAGVVTSAAVFSIAALAIMLVLMFGGADFSSGSSTSKSKTAGAAVTNTNTAGSGGSEVTGSFDIDKIRNVRGEGSFTIIEFSDYDCPFCSRFHTTMKQVVEDYDGQVAWGYHHFPLASLHPNAADVAEAAECADDQEKFAEFTDTYFDPESAGITSSGDDKITDVAENVGLNMDDFNNCWESDTYADLVKSDTTDAQSLGARGTPFSVIVDENGNIVGTINGAQPYESISAQLDNLLN